MSVGWNVSSVRVCFSTPLQHSIVLEDMMKRSNIPIGSINDQQDRIRFLQAFRILVVVFSG